MGALMKSKQQFNDEYYYLNKRYKNKIIKTHQKTMEEFHQFIKSISIRSGYLKYEWAQLLSFGKLQTNISKLYNEYSTVIKQNCQNNGKKLVFFRPQQIRQLFNNQFKSKFKMQSTNVTMDVVKLALEECRCYLMVLKWLNQPIDVFNDIVNLPKQQKKIERNHYSNILQRQNLLWNVLHKLVEVNLQNNFRNQYLLSQKDKQIFSNIEIIKYVKKIDSKQTILTLEQTIKKIKIALKTRYMQDWALILRAVVEGIGVKRVYCAVQIINELGSEDISEVWNVIKNYNIYIINDCILSEYQIYKRMIGIIIPPGDIKKLVEKTAEHVALNGSQFEQMILEREQHKVQFAFLQPDNPYRGYYDHMVGDFSRKIIEEAQRSIQTQTNNMKKQDEENIEKHKIQQEQKQVQVKNQQTIRLQNLFQKIKQPQSDKYIAELPEKLTEAQMAIIKHTAQFVAKNGKNFLVAVSQREKNNPQFQFLNTSSDNYQYFMALIEGYKNVLNFQNTTLKKLNEYIQSKQNIFSKCQMVYQYHKAKQLQMKDKKQQPQKKEANVDWNDYELVETITFEQYEQNRLKGYQQQEIRNRIQQMSLNSSYNYIMQEKIISQPKKKQILQQCHACKKNILASQMNKHLKSCLSINKTAVTNVVQNNLQDVDIRGNLEGLSQSRPDIFRPTGQETLNQIDAPKIMWDGQAPNMTRTTASVAMVQNEQKKIKDQLKKKQS